MRGGFRRICCRAPAPITRSGSRDSPGGRRRGRGRRPTRSTASAICRKFKVGLAVPQDNTIDVLSNDLAIVALFADGRLIGYNFLLGGGHGMTHNNPQTYPRLATPVAFIEPEDLLAAAAAAVKLHRDYGDRGNRRHARLKYVIAERGEEWARARLAEYLGKPLAPCRPMPPFA